jgi:hypothetical protein
MDLDIIVKFINLAIKCYKILPFEFIISNILL